MAGQDRARWTKLVADSEVSALSQRGFAQACGITLSNLRYWIYRLAARDGADEAPRSRA